jgi:hypothetical protein
MSVPSRLRYWRRLTSAYLLPGKSQLTFWHDTPRAEQGFDTKQVGPYYMRFDEKADYDGLFDDNGIPMLDYRGSIGPQYNPIAIAQYGLGNYNLFRETSESNRRQRFLAAADWLVDNLELHLGGTHVWMHHFDFEYRDMLRAPWHSGLAQGQGLSLLTRAHVETGDRRYEGAAEIAFLAFCSDMSEGGVVHLDDSGQPWVEEYPASPPTHILNGFIWALWGVRDHALATGSTEADSLWDQSVETLVNNLHLYETKNWSLYDLSSTGRMKMVASGFYHRLHIVQLRIMADLTGNPVFERYADRWENLAARRWNRLYNRGYKAVFKVLKY